MKILALAASTNSQSINKKLLSHAIDIVKGEIETDAEIELLDLNDFEMPLYSADRELSGGIPEPAHRFHQQIKGSDALLFSFAEHNGSYTATFKNLFDWTSRIEKVAGVSNVYHGKPMVLLSTSPGPKGGGNVLEFVRRTAPFFGGDVRSALSVPAFYQAFDLETGQLTSPDMRAALHDTLAAFQTSTLRQAAAT